MKLAKLKIGQNIRVKAGIDDETRLEVIQKWYEFLDQLHGSVKSSEFGKGLGNVQDLVMYYLKEIAKLRPHAQDLGFAPKLKRYEDALDALSDMIERINYSMGLEEKTLLKDTNDAEKDYKELQKKLGAD